MSQEGIFLLTGLLVALAIVLILALYLFRIAATALVWFSAIILETPWWIVVPGFIILPPAFVAFLGGMALMVFGEFDDNGRWRSNRYWRRVGIKSSKYREGLGYKE